MAWADKASRSGRLSLLVCTPDRYSKRTVRCLSAIRDTTKGIEYDLVLLDNRNRLSGYDKGVFRRKWIDTGRYSSLEAHYGGEWHGPLRKSMYA